MNKHDAKLRKWYGISHRTVIERLIKTFNKATPADIEAGAEWYPLAAEIASDLAKQSGYSKNCCAAVIAHLSPRQMWARNVLAAHSILVDKAVLPGTMGREAGKAATAIEFDGREEDVAHSFGPKSKKTLRFYQNIMGDHECVTVDVWALRAAGFDDDELLDRAGVYEAFEHAYQVAARRKGVSPATFQATCWVVARGGRSD